MYKQKYSVTLVLLAVVLALSIGNMSLVNAQPVPSYSGVQALLAKVRSETAKYHDVSVALTDGYIAASPCEEIQGVGVMGIHYVNFALAIDLVVNELEPEMLLYVPFDGGFRLVGVEYYATALANTAAGPQPWFGVDPPPLGWFNSAPTVFGESLDGPMPGHGPGIPWHYDFHVWLWQANPSGIFAEFNPNVQC
jgi:hypothetical protein